MSYLMLDVAGHRLDTTDKENLKSQHVGGVILFSRNYASKEQLTALIKEIRAINKDILIAVDHEGGRVQRFKDEFTLIPAMGSILHAANNDLNLAKEWATELGFLMAIEVLAMDIDLSFAPVLDLHGISEIIGNRSFGATPDIVIALARCFIKGMNAAGMHSVGKHFPGHGSVKADSHLEIVKDNRDFELIKYDMEPFKQLISESMLQGIMPAHIIYPQVDENPAGFSTYWLKNILRKEFLFKGVIFSDDLGMKGAAIASYCERAKLAFNAGCDMVLLCNDPDGVKELLTNFSWPTTQTYNPKTLKPNLELVAIALEDEVRWIKAREIALKIESITKQ